MKRGRNTQSLNPGSRGLVLTLLVEVEFVKHDVAICGAKSLPLSLEPLDTTFGL